MGSARLEAAPDREAVTLRLWTALQAVSDPDAYASTGQDHRPVARAALVKRAKAMTGLFLFEIEGLIRAFNRYRDKGICHTPSVVHNAWLRCLQLQGRQAHLVVPMDGWLVSAFPRSLVTSDQSVLDTLAASRRLGGTEQATLGVPLPDALLVPAKLFGRLVQVPDLSDEVAALLWRHPETASELQPSGGRAFSSSVATRLIADFTATLIGNTPGSIDYPGN